MKALPWLFAILLCALPFWGGEALSLSELWHGDVAARRIFFELRLPRLLVTLIAGGGLAVLGGSYQLLFNNPLAEPYILGVSSSVTLGIALAEIFFQLPQGTLGSRLVGFLCAAIVTLFLARIANSRFGNSVERVVLFGMAINFVLSAVLFLALSYHFQHVGGGSLRWLFGQIPWLGLQDAATLAAICVFFLAPLLLFSRHLDALQLGDSVATTLGLNPARSRAALVLVTSFLVASIVSVTGSIGFVGLVVPHVVRLVFRPDSARKLLLLSLLVGGLFLSFSDVLSRAILPPFEFPVGVVTTALGGPIFLWLLWKR